MARVRDRLLREGFDTRYSTTKLGAIDGRLLVRGHGTSQAFATHEFSGRLDDRWHLVAEEWRQAKASSTAPTALLVVATTISEPAADQLWEAGISFIDGNGMGYLKFPDLAYELGPDRVPRKVFRTERRTPSAPSSALTPAGLSVGLVALLSPPLLATPLRDITELVPASLGTVQGAISDLQESGYASRSGRLLAPKRLLDDWTSAYLRNYPKWHPSERYETEMSLATIRARLADVRSNVPAWLSGEGAVEEQGMSIRSTTVMIYVSDEHRLQLNKLLRLRRSDSGRVEVATAFWSPTLVPPPFAPSPVVRADLLATKDPRQHEMVERLETDDPVLRRLTGGS
ncbi:MAG: type IV toxin-antitoxin system AbiEi family antitoxin [Nostocoides sp.]